MPFGLEGKEEGKVEQKGKLHTPQKSKAQGPTEPEQPAKKKQTSAPPVPNQSQEDLLLYKGIKLEHSKQQKLRRNTEA